MSNSESCPDWQLPPGVSRGTWDYLHAEHIAHDYDDYHAFNRLFEFDEALLLRWMDPARSPEGSRVADLGCGTGRALVHLTRHGFRGLAVDLSPHMLDIVRQKAALEQLPIETLQANLVELDAHLPAGSIDYAICLFSTLGMVRGHANRQLCLRHVRRALRPGGRFILHVHNYWYNLYDPGGPRWLLSNAWRHFVLRDTELGDKFFFYRGIPNMYLHVFRPGELRGLLRQAGFRIVEWLPLAPQRYRELPARWCLSACRANGWIVVGECGEASAAG